MPKTWLLCLLLSSALSITNARAQEIATDAWDDAQAAEDADDGGEVRDLGIYVVSGAQPGPGLWKVRHGEHTLYLLGTVSPLPRGMEWRSDEVAAVLDEADVVLGQPGITVGSNIGRLRGLTLLPSAMRATNNPGGETLQDVLPADVYARWTSLKAVHIGRDAGIERKRPMFAAMRLYQRAVRGAGLRDGGVVSPVVEAALKRRRMRITPTMLQVSIDDPRGALADFREEALKPEDIECFSRTMDIVERELPEMAARANAWAVGDIAALQSMPLESQYRACLSAWSGSEVARKRGFTDIDRRVRERWLAVAEPALREHRVVFGTVSVAELLRPGGYLEQLAAKGYEVEAP
ncbi:TraB/GumN family protein [Luteimonas aestuarii]|uniref:TraB/GumN family protein n=1 Tax=Luteimonas aestuarii TaxID=453837 RepID=A0A4R5TYD5_9GAMM|nr:TraB/GumN family protein [Luteimonas aestuarii]TDK26228.1 TraB/GumN family protein [Luteimonas aestuarii]